MYKQANIDYEKVNNEIRELNDFKNSIEGVREDIENLKNNNDIKKSLLLLEENDENLNQNLIYLKEKIEKYSQKPMLDEIETSIYSVHSDHKIMQKKVQVIEDMLVSNRNDFVNQASDLEKFFIGKNENLKQAICHIWRTLKVTNPLI